MDLPLEQRIAERPATGPGELRFESQAIEWLAEYARANFWPTPTYSYKLNPGNPPTHTAEVRVHGHKSPLVGRSGKEPSRDQAQTFSALAAIQSLAPEMTLPGPLDIEINAVTALTNALKANAWTLKFGAPAEISRRPQVIRIQLTIFPENFAFDGEGGSMKEAKAVAATQAIRELLKSGKLSSTAPALVKTGQTKVPMRTENRTGHPSGKPAAVDLNTYLTAPGELLCIQHAPLWLEAYCQAKSVGPVVYDESYGGLVGMREFHSVATLTIGRNRYIGRGNSQLSQCAKRNAAVELMRKLDKSVVIPPVPQAEAFAVRKLKEFLRRIKASEPLEERVRVLHPFHQEFEYRYSLGSEIPTFSGISPAESEAPVVAATKALHFIRAREHREKAMLWVEQVMADNQLQRAKEAQIAQAEIKPEWHASMRSLLQLALKRVGPGYKATEKTSLSWDVTMPAGEVATIEVSGDRLITRARARLKPGFSPRLPLPRISIEVDYAPTTAAEQIRTALLEPVEAAMAISLPATIRKIDLGSFDPNLDPYVTAQSPVFREGFMAGAMELTPEDSPYGDSLLVAADWFSGLFYASLSCTVCGAKNSAGARCHPRGEGESGHCLQCERARAPAAASIFTSAGLAAAALQEIRVEWDVAPFASIRFYALPRKPKSTDFWAFVLVTNGTLQDCIDDEIDPHRHSAIEITETQLLDISGSLTACG